MKMTRLLIGLLLAISMVACSSSLRVRMHAASQQKPSNIAMFFSVEDPDGGPIGALSADQFRIYEDEAFISPFESKQTILNPEVAAAHHALLLLDLSGSITESGSTPQLIDAATMFAERLLDEGHSELAIYGFDGSENLHIISSFTKNKGYAKSAIKKLQSFKSRDPSTNLHGAVVQSIDILERKVAKAKQPIRFASLVVFTDGTDRAHRVSEEEVQNALDDADVDVFAIGLGVEISPEQLDRLGTSGFVSARDRMGLSEAFSNIATQIEGAAKKFYLLSYCSPARAGKHRLRIEANSGELRGSVAYEFDAEGFGPRCDPNKKPAFSIERVLLQEGRDKQKDKATQEEPAKSKKGGGK